MHKLGTVHRGAGHGRGTWRLGWHLRGLRRRFQTLSLQQRNQTSLERLSEFIKLYICEHHSDLKAKITGDTRFLHITHNELGAFSPFLFPQRQSCRGLGVLLQTHMHATDARNTLTFLHNSLGSRYSSMAAKERERESAL